MKTSSVYRWSRGHFWEKRLWEMSYFVSLETYETWTESINGSEPRVSTRDCSTEAADDDDVMLWWPSAGAYSLLLNPASWHSSPSLLDNNSRWRVCNRQGTTFRRENSLCTSVDLFSALCQSYMAYATSMTYVRPSVTLVDCYYTVQQKVKIGKWQLYAEIDPDRIILWSCLWKNVEFCTLAASNGLHVALSQHLLNFLLFVAHDSYRVRLKGPTSKFSCILHVFTTSLCT